VDLEFHYLIVLYDYGSGGSNSDMFTRRFEAEIYHTYAPRGAFSFEVADHRAEGVFLKS
jgi:hypothetical protein